MKDTYLSTKQSEELRRRIKDVVSSHKKASLDLCEVIYESDVQMTRVKGDYVYCWKAWGFESWEDYVGVEIGMHMTTAYAYKKIWEVFCVDLVGAWDVGLLQPITKMRLLSAALLNKKNVNAWLRKAATMNCRELRAAVYDTEELRHFSIEVSDPQLNRINRVLEQGRAVYGEVSKGQLLANILKEWSDKKGLRAAA